MNRLLQAEFKKFFKSKLNIILLLCLMVFTGYSCVQVYAIHSSEDLKDTQGNAVSWLDYWRLADQTQHQYAGTLTTTTLENMKKDYSSIMEAYPQDELDVETMTRFYGESYEESIEKAENGEYTLEEFRDKFSQYMQAKGGLFYDEIPNSDRIKVSLERVYKNDPVRQLYSNIYNIDRSKLDQESNTIPINTTLVDEYLMTYSRSLSMSKKEVQDLLFFQQTLPKEYAAVVDEYTTRYTSSNHQFDSIIGNTLYVNSLQSLSIAGLLVIVILLSNQFAMDKYYKTEQIMISTSKGYRKSVIAKLLCGFLITLGIVVTQLLLVTLISNLLVGMRDLSLTYYPQSRAIINRVPEFTFTYLELIVNAYSLIGISCLATASCTMLLSYFTKNRFAVVIPLWILIVVTNLIPWFDHASNAFPLDYFMPGLMVNFTDFFYRPYVSGLFVPYFYFGTTIVAWKDIILLTWVVLILLISGAIYLKSRKHVVTYT